MTNMAGKTLEIIHRVHELFKARGLTLSLAESCTGGLISHYITHLPGASAFFKAGVVSYSAEMKIEDSGRLFRYYCIIRRCQRADGKRNG